MYAFPFKCKYIGILVLFFLISLFTYFTQNFINSHKDVELATDHFMFLPKGEFIKPVVMGYDQLAADLIWLQAIQVIGEKTVTPDGYQWIYHALDVVTTLDPEFAYAYQLGGVVLSVLAKTPDKSNELLLKGMKENPHIWQIPFYVGFNHFFYMKDYKKAAEYMAKASELPGHPEYLPRLAAKLYVQAGDPTVALEFLMRMHHDSNDEKVRAGLEERIRDVIVERDAGYLEDAVKRYKETYKRHPVQLIELVDQGIIKSIPEEPSGGYYYFNPKDEKVYSSLLRKRMMVYGRDSNNN